MKSLRMMPVEAVLKHNWSDLRSVTFDETRPVAFEIAKAHVELSPTNVIVVSPHTGPRGGHGALSFASQRATGQFWHPLSRRMQRPNPAVVWLGTIIYVGRHDTEIGQIDSVRFVTSPVIKA